MQEAKNYVKATVQTVVLFAFLFSLVCLIFTDGLVGFFGLEEPAAVNCAVRYTRITCGMIVFSFLNVTLAGISTAQGDSRTPLLANFVGLVLNMILDPLLILGVGFLPRLEDTGAAAATVASQAVVLVVMICSFWLSGKSSLLRGLNYFRKLPWKYYKNILVLGFPAGLQSLIYCFISMVLGRIIARFGSAAYAVARVGGQIESLTWNTADGFGSALNAFCGQNFGAGEYDRIRKGYKFSWITMFIWGSIVAAAFILVPGLISGIFFHEEDAIGFSIGYLMIVGICEPFMCVELMTNSALCGLGLTKLCSIITIILTSLRIPLAYLLTESMNGVTGVWWALSLTSISKGIVFTAVFLAVSGKMHKLRRLSE